MAGISFGPLDGVSGYWLLIGFSALIFIEECGVPLPFAPGDLVLVACGIDVATGNLLVPFAIAFTSLSVFSGALVGREIFARIGSRLMYRIADFFGVRGGLGRLADSLRRTGWYGVLLGRLTPGLRVHTTEAAGLVGMRRTTFVAGLVPAIAIYEGVFFGLGYWLGPAAWSFLEAYAPSPGPIVVGVVALIGLITTYRWLTGTERRRPESA